MDRRPVPASCAIAFKEWAGVCEALASGRQSLILRKGGIEEGPGGFVPEHPAFWLYPTHVHEAEQGLKSPATAAGPLRPGSVSIRTLAVVEEIARVDRLGDLLRLHPFHAWTEETVRKRFAYRRPGLWVVAVRAYNLPDPEDVEVTPDQLGCKTWVPLRTPLSALGAVPARADEEASSDLARLRYALEASAEGPAS